MTLSIKGLSTQVLSVIAFSTIAALSHSQSAQAQTFASGTLISDDFDSESIGLNYNSFENWTVKDGTVDLIGSGSYWDLFPGEGRYLDMDGSTSNAGNLESKESFLFSAGTTVTLSFDILGQNPGATGNNFLTVGLGSLFSETFDVSDTGTNTRSFVVDAETAAKLSFDHAGGDNGGLVLDNVYLSAAEAPASVPEPAMLLGLSAVAGLGAMKQRKR